MARKRKEDYRKLTAGLVLKRNPARKSTVTDKKSVKELLKRALGQSAFDKGENEARNDL